MNLFNYFAQECVPEDVVQVRFFMTSVNPWLNRKGESALEEVKKELKDMDDSLSKATAEAEKAAGTKKKLEDEEAVALKKIEASRTALKAAGEELAR